MCCFGVNMWFVDVSMLTPPTGVCSRLVSLLLWTPGAFPLDMLLRNCLIVL